MIFFLGSLFTVVIGALLYNICRQGKSVSKLAVILPVNQSVWEKFKVVFWPMVIFSIAEYFSYGQYFDNFIAAKAFSILCAMVWMAVLTYIFRAIWGKIPFSCEIGIFAVSCALAYTVNYITVKNYFLYSAFDRIFGIIAIIILMICFAVFSFSPPNYALFKENNS